MEGPPLARGTVRVYPSRVTTQGPPPGGAPIDPRLARPAASPAPPSAPRPPAPQPLETLDPPAFGELIASGALGLFSPAETYGGLARRPEPTPADVALALLAWGGCAAALFIAFAMTRLNAASWGVIPLAGGALGALILAAPAGLAAGAVLHALAMLSGGQGGYWRSAQATAALGAVPSLLVAALWAAPDPAWLAAPLLVGTWLAVSAVEKLHDAPVGQAWMVIGFVGALLAGSAVLAHDKVSLALVRLENAATVLSNNPGTHSEPSHSTAGLAAPLAAPSMPGAVEDRLSGKTGAAGPIEADPGAGAAPGRSSLDFLRAEGDEGVDESGAPSPARLADDERMRQAQAMQQNAAGLIQRLSKDLGKASDSMPPEQAAKLRKMLDGLQKGMGGGGAQGSAMMTPADTQKLLQQILGAISKQGAAQDPAPPPSGQRRRAAPPAPAD